MSNKNRRDWLKSFSNNLPLSTIIESPPKSPKEEVIENEIIVNEIVEEIKPITNNTILNGKYICECGKSVTISNKEKHLSTKYHLHRIQ